MLAAHCDALTFKSPDKHFFSQCFVVVLKLSKIRARTLRIGRGDDQKAVIRVDDGTVAKAAYSKRDVLPLVTQHRGDAHVRVQLRATATLINLKRLCQSRTRLSR